MAVKTSKSDWTTRTSNEPMQKYFVAYQAQEEPAGVTSYSFTFARKQGEARKRAEGKAGKGKKIVAIWVCEVADLEQTPRQILGVADGKNAPSLVQSMLNGARASYKVSEIKKKHKPHIKCLPPPVPKKPKTELYQPYGLVSADDYTRPTAKKVP